MVRLTPASCATFMIVGDLSTAASIAPQSMSIGVQFSTWWIGSSTWMVQGCERIERGMVHEALIILMDNRLTGETPISLIRRELAQ